LVAQAVDLLLQEQEGRILLFSGTHLPPMSGALPDGKKEQGDENGKKNDDPDLIYLALGATVRHSRNQKKQKPTIRF